MKKQGLLILLLVFLFIPSPVFATVTDEYGIKFSIKPYEGFSSYYKETDYDFKIEKGQPFLLYLEIENTNDQEMILKDFYINNIRLADLIPLGKKSTTLAFRRIHVPKEIFERFGVNELYANDEDFMVTEKLGITIQQDFKVSYRLDLRYYLQPYKVTIGSFNFKTGISDEINTLRNEKKKSENKRVYGILAAVFWGLSIILVIYLKVKGNDKKHIYAPLILALIAVIFTLFSIY